MYTSYNCFLTCVNLSVARAPRVKKTSGSPGKKQNSGSPGKKKGGKKRNPWSESEESDQDISSDNDMDGSFLEDVIPREKPVPRRAGMLIYKVFITEWIHISYYIA